MSAAMQDQLSAIRDKAKSLHQVGRLPEALAAHAEALRLAPDAVGIWLSAAKLAHLMELQEVSLQYFEQAARLDPGCLAAVDAARKICIGAGLSERAAHYSRLAQTLSSSAEIAFSERLVLPAILQSKDSIQQSRDRYRRGLDDALASPVRFDTPEGAIGITGFFLAYHGENDRDLQAAAARLYLQAIPSLSMTARHCNGSPRRTGKIRIGFISRFFSSHSISSTSIGLIERLSRERFEVWVLRINPSRDDDATARIRAASDHALELDPDFYRAREQIAALELDVLFYQDIGMEQTSYFLAFARLARVQCVSFGHPNTTGIPTMDYFISNDLFEPEGAEAHYSEKLVQLQDLPTLAYYYKPALPSTEAVPETFGLPGEATLYVCPQTLYKLHPDFDELVRGILSRDPQGLVVLISGGFQMFAQQMRERFARVIPGLAQRIVFIPFQPFERFMQLLQLADVILDSVHFNGMNSTLQALAVGTPVVTLPGRFQRGRHTQAMYQKMGILDCVASDPQHYVDIAVRIGMNGVYAYELRQRILSRNHVLYQDSRVVEEFERFFAAAVG